MSDRIKQVIVVRSDLNMGKGKIAAQVAHAAILSYENTKKVNKKIAEEWFREGMPKIVLKVSGKEELYRYYQMAKDNGLPCAIISDAGRTQIEPGTTTCFGVGPWYSEELDKLYGDLKLL